MPPPLSRLPFLALLAAPTLLGAAPVELARESFEGAGGAIGFTTSVPQFDEPTLATSDFFSVQPNNGTKLSAGTLGGGDGANMFAAEDIDTVPGPGVSPTQSVTFNAFNIAGKTNTSVKVLLAAPGNGTSQAFYDWSGTAAEIDLLRVEASVDGGPFNRLAQFAPSTANLNQPLSLDTDGNGVGDSTPLTAAFQEFEFPFPTGTSVQIQVVMHSNGTSEYLCLDNVRIFGDSPATAPPSLAGVPATTLAFTEGGTAAALAPALTVADPDSTTLPSASVVISQNLTSGEDVLAATPSGAILAGDIVYTAATGTLTITRSASLADYQSVLRSVTYQNSNGSSPNTATRQIRFSTTDGVNASNAPVREVSVTDNIALQTLPFTESFETDGRGTRYALDGRFTNGAATFDRGQPTGTSNLDGTSAIIAEDTQLDAAPVKASRVLLNTAGRVGVTATVRLGALGGAIFDTGDSIVVESSVDGGPFTQVAAFRSTGPSNAPLALDSDNDGTGDGTQLSAALQDFVFNLPDATTLGLRVRCQSNVAGERLIVDRLVVDGTLQEFNIADASASESTATRSFTVSRTVSSGADTVQFATSNGTAIAGNDYQADSGTVSFADGQSTRSVTINITPDNTVELDETFTVTLSNPSRGTITDASGTGTIVNDDSSVVSLTGGSVTEGDSGSASLGYSYSLTNPVDIAISFDHSTLGTGTATPGTDFTTLTNVTTNVPANTTSGNFNITVAGDNDPESNETVPVELSSLAAGGRSVSFASGGAILTSNGSILDDDPVIVAGTGGIGMGVGASGKMTVASLLALASGGEGRPLSLVSVQSPSPNGGTVSVSEGWLIYEPAAGFSGADSFTYTVSDGFQTVTGTVNVVASNGIGQTVNILAVVPNGAGNRLTALGIPGRSYQWQTSSNLTTWTTLGAPIACPASGVITQTDPGPLPPIRFYRMVQAATPPPL